MRLAQDDPFLILLLWDAAFVPDHVDFSKLNIASHVTPRVLAYNNYRLSTLIASDEISKSSFGARPVKDDQPLSIIFSHVDLDYVPTCS